MNLSDLNALSGGVLLTPSVVTASGNGAAVDLQQFIGVLKATQRVGAVAGTSPTLDGKIQDSADGATFADVAGYAFPTVTAPNSDQSIQVDTRAVRRYIRYVDTVGGTNSPSFVVSATFIGQRKVM